MSPVEDARALVSERFPDAAWAILAGSVLTWLSRTVRPTTTG
ncbi:hypothetical protein [Actinoplanes sp. NBRC 103695]|nr:hypothetical protein [Actinoplanes sp. NBRC 103695]